jgi:HPt (histidine-containing phosphotransfer) domain-containing protein
MELELINWEGGLARLGGNEAIFKKLLKHYLADDYFPKLQACVDDKNAEEATRAAHTIKGVAANLSLTAVANASRELEELFKAGQLDCEPQIAALKSVMEQTTAKIEELTA